MKTRIISGIVMGALVAVVLCLGLLVSPIFINLFVGVVLAIGLYELIHNAAGINSKSAIICAGIYGILSPFAFSQDISVFNMWSIAYFVFAAFIILINHKDFSFAQLGFFSALPILIAFSLSSLAYVLTDGGIYYLVLILTFSSICDMGAYFVGVTMGKTKLCPEISPKKTVEGAIGGIVSAIVFAVIFCLLFGHKNDLLATILVTIPLCILGMAGDLFASIIKRKVELKDYGTLIPGHGGVLDRVDSMLFITPAVFMLVDFGVI